MKRLAVAAVLLAGCSAAPTERYGFVARLGQDTVSVESVTRRGSHLVSDEVDRFPRVHRRHTEITLGPAGGIQHLSMDIVTPSEPANERERHVVADVVGDSVIMTKRDRESYKRWAYASNGAIVMAHVPQMYSLYELYFSAALRHIAMAPAEGDTVGLRQFYPDREFDRFPLHHATVRRLSDSTAEIWHDWLSGVGEATVDSSDRLLRYSGARTTYKVQVDRIAAPADVQQIGERFAAIEARQGGVHALSVRDTARGEIGGASLMVDYGRPLARGRTLLGGVIPYGQVWRTGANAATQFTTSKPIRVAGASLPAGTYTLWTLPQPSGATLIINGQSGQWGTEYHQDRDLVRVPLTVSRPGGAAVEEFTMSIRRDDARRGALTMAWGDFEWAAPIEVPAR